MRWWTPVAVAVASDLQDIADKVERGERLSFDDGVRLMRSPDLLAIGRLADLVRRRKNGDRAYFVVNAHLNYTNVCWVDCKFCAFQRRPNQPGGYAMTAEQIEAHCREKVAGRGFSELHVVGGVHPALPFSYYEEMLQAIRRALPDIHVQALTAVEVDFAARRGGLTLREALLRLRAAGLDSLPGGGAEIFAGRVRDLIYPHKIPAARWLEVHETAHSLGIRSNASILYGHIETPEEVIDHLCRLRELQDRTGGFLAFLAFAFHPENTQLERLYPGRYGTTGYDDLKMYAVARLMLDNFDHIKAFWMAMGWKLAQVSLSFGVDDLDGTVMEERILHAAGARTEQCTPKERFVEMIRQAGRTPVERDTLFRPLRVY